MYRAGLRELKLIYSSKPKWYFRLAEKTLRSVIESYITLFGVRRFLAGFSSPVFFDALAASAYLDELGGGATTIIAVTLKNYLRSEMGLAVVGGKRLQGYRVPAELDLVAEVFNFSDQVLSKLKYSSRMVAKVDSAAVQDGFELYLHMMLVSSDADWVVVQQGIKPMTNLVRRYHWASWRVRSFVEEPHAGIISTTREEVVLDMTDKESREARKACVEAVNEDLERLREFHRRPARGQLTLTDFEGEDRRPKRIDVPRIKWSAILKAREASPKNFEELLSLQGVGPATIKFLAAACIDLYGVYPSMNDPAILFEEVVNGGLMEDKWVYELVEAVKASDLTMNEKRRSLSRLSSLFSSLELS